jgi:hypothetical protein
VPDVHVPLIDDFGVDTHVASPNLAGWLRVTAAAISFPGGVERSHTQKRWRPGNAFSRKSLHIPSTRFAAFKSPRSEAGASSYLNEASAHPVGDLHSHVTAPAFSRIEGNDAHRIFVLPVE